jgi:double-stranded uracil-DNA glycosylase
MLPDLLEPNLIVVFCGTGAGRISAEVGQYYANPGNKFWPILYKSGFTPHQFDPSEYAKLLTLGIGLTDLSKKKPGPDSQRQEKDYDIDALTSKILAFQPKYLAFTSKKAASLYFGKKTAEIEYGLQSELVGTSKFYVLPSTSGAGAGYWRDEPWMKLAELYGAF